MRPNFHSFKVEININAIYSYIFNFCKRLEICSLLMPVVVHTAA